MRRTDLPRPRTYQTRPVGAALIPAGAAAAILGMKPSWFHKLRRRGDMPLTVYHSNGSDIAMFDRREVSYIAKRR